MSSLQTHLSFAFTVALILLCIASFPATAVADECQPYTWEPMNKRRAVSADPSSTKPPSPTFTFAVPKISKHKPGDLNCRNWGKTYKTVNYYSCKKLALQFGIDVEEFFKLNPTLDPDCENITPYTMYCVAGCKPSSYPQSLIDLQQTQVLMTCSY
jgi:hypothetical protein